MKKILIALMAVIGLMAFTGCGDVSGDGLANLFPTTKGDKGDKGDTGATGQSAYEIWLEQGNEGTPEDFIASLVGADGQSAYEIAVGNGFEGTVEEWLQTLVGAPGADGEDGTCDCDGNATEPPVLPDNVIKMTFSTSLTGLTALKVGHLRNGEIILIEDANVTEDNGTTTVIYDMPVDNNGSHMIGLQFDK